MNPPFLSNQNSDEKSFRILEQPMQEMSVYQRNLLRINYQEGVEITTIARQQKATLSAVKTAILTSMPRPNKLIDRRFS